MIVTLVSLIFFGILAMFGVLWINSLYWDNGKVPPYFKYNKENELEILIALAGNLIRKDFRNIGEKKMFVTSYFHQYFRNDTYDFTDSFKNAYSNPLRLDSIATWYNRHVKSDQHRLSVIQFALNIAMIDGNLVSTEYAALQKFHRALRLPDAEFDRLVSIHLRNQQARTEQERRSEQRSATHSVSQRERCCAILGVTANADAQTIKKAYRSLAKIHHPDRMTNATPVQKQLAKERFIAIQQAYEFLERA